MVEKAQFVNVKINVDGKVHNVKVEKGVTFNSCFVLGENKLVKYDTKDFADKENYDYGVKIRPEYISDVKMSKDEFNVFKNFADNVQEKGGELILSKQDIYEAENLFREGKFSKDISRNLDGFVQRDQQELYTDDGATTIVADVSYQEMVYSDSDIYSEKIRNFAKKSANREVKQLFHGDDGIVGYKYTDKEGKSHFYDNYYHSETITYKDGNKSIIEEYDDKGKLIKKQIAGQ